MFYILRPKKQVGEVSNFEKFCRQSCRLRTDATFHQKLILLDKYLLNEGVFKKALGRVVCGTTANHTASLKNWQWLLLIFFIDNNFN